MVAFRWSKSVATSAAPKFRWAKSTAQGTSAAPRFRWAKSLTQGVTNISLQPIADVTADAYDSVTITAFPTALSVPPTSYVWRQIIAPGDPTVSFVATGDHIVFAVPATMAGVTLTFGVTAYAGTTPSTEVTAKVIAKPHLYWLVSDSSTWVDVSRPAIV